MTFHRQFRLADGPVRVDVAVGHASQQFAVNGNAVGSVLDASMISDEGGRGEHASFTGAFAGLVAYDLTGQSRTAGVTRVAVRRHIDAWHLITS